MNDLISRQAAIDAVKRNTFRLTFAEEQNCEGHVAWSAEAVYSDVMEGELLELPSAQPEHLVKESGGLVKDLVNDTISRQMAVKEAKELYDMGDCYCDRESMIGMLNSLPSAQPEIIQCKDCKYSEYWYKDKRRCFLWNEAGIDVFEDGYCNYAKRRMRGEQDE